MMMSRITQITSTARKGWDEKPRPKAIAWETGTEQQWFIYCISF